MAMKLLSLLLYCTEPKQTTPEPMRACRRTQWAMDQVALALRKLDSVPGKALHETGFCSVVLVGPDGAIQHVEGFDSGFCAVINPSGGSVDVTDKEPESNAQDCLAFLDKVLRYCIWAATVGDAKRCGIRPPVLEGDLNIQALHRWVGVEAFEYLEYWKSQAFKRAAKQSADRAGETLEFAADLEKAVRNIESMTSTASAERGA